MVGVRVGVRVTVRVRVKVRVRVTVRIRLWSYLLRSRVLRRDGAVYNWLGLGLGLGLGSLGETGPCIIGSLVPLV